MLRIPKMKIISFACESIDLLKSHLSKPIGFISYESAEATGPMSVTLWYQDGVGIQVRSKMYDIGERMEVGVLSFTWVTSPKHDEQCLEVQSSFKRKIRVFKLQIDESGVRAESGIALRS